MGVTSRTFSCIENAELREVAQQDYVDAQKAYAAGVYKPVAWLAASVIEAMLLDRLQRSDVQERADYTDAVKNFSRDRDSAIQWRRVGLFLLLQAGNALGFTPTSASLGLDFTIGSP